MTKKITNEEMLEIAGKVFATYDLPEGAQVRTDYLGETVQIGYVYISGDGEEEMRQIVEALKHLKQVKYEIFEELIVIKDVIFISAGRRTVTLRAQMEVKENPSEALVEAVDRVLESIGLGK